MTLSAFFAVSVLRAKFDGDAFLTKAAISKQEQKRSVDVDYSQSVKCVRYIRRVGLNKLASRCFVVYGGVCHLIVSDWRSSCFWGRGFEYGWVCFGSRRWRSRGGCGSGNCKWNLPQQTLLTHRAGHRWLEGKPAEILFTSENSS